MAKYVVRYGAMRSLGLMNARDDSQYRRGAEVIVRTNRGLESGQVLCDATADALSHLDQPTTGQVIRLLTSEDANELNHLQDQRNDKIAACEKHIADLSLDMKLVEIEQLFGGERIIVYYLAADRVDFRQLVKLLAADFQTRIEMKQIGVRDEARLLADYGDCGKPVCCNTHLTTMPPVSMRMAKLQKATLDPTKISGRCGRLKCCLRYEFDHYDEVQKSMPKIGSRIVTRQGKAKVLNHELLAEQLLVETEDHRRILIPASDVLTVLK
jgi:cell fate regulator YaaT (PSP1 superfamily)